MCSVPSDALRCGLRCLVNFGSLETLPVCIVLQVIIILQLKYNVIIMHNNCCLVPLLPSLMFRRKIHRVIPELCNRLMDGEKHFVMLQHNANLI